MNLQLLSFLPSSPCAAFQIHTRITRPFPSLQTMIAERDRSEASCAGVLERAAHSWLRIWQVQRVYAGSPEAALLALPWRGHLSFPFLHWKKTTQDKVARRRARRKADLERKRRLFTSWRQVATGALLSYRSSFLESIVWTSSTVAPSGNGSTADSHL